MSFQQGLKNGGYGEHAVWNMFNKMPKVRSVVDVREDKLFQASDIDFLVETIDRQFSAIEVKTDYKAHETGNIVYEVTTGGQIGCFEKTKAKYIAYFVPKSETVYLIGTRNFRQYVHNQELEPKRMGDDATGYLFSIEELIKNKIILRTYEGVV
jgi:hypothetical protein